MDEVFPYETWTAFADRAKRLELDRDSLLLGMPIELLGHLPRKTDYRSQIDSDVSWLNKRATPRDGLLAIERWLRNASRNSAFDAEAAKYFRDLADAALVLAQPATPGSRAPDRAASPPAEAASAAATLDGVLPEKVLFENDLLPIGFLHGAARTARSVARIVVSRYENGMVRTNGDTGLPVRYLGTCWMIGPRHAITNHHVIAARSPGEAAASASDFDLQAQNCTIEFDYDDLDQLPTANAALKLLAADAGLDFAVVELAPCTPEFDRPPLPLARSPLQIEVSNPPSVNIVQHPGGLPKRLAIRNNAAVTLDEANLSYFTDTEPGSSGSPVCNDQWQVVALHKAADRHRGKFTYQGRETNWVNIGTPIAAIIAELERLGLFAAIGATVV